MQPVYHVDVHDADTRQPAPPPSARGSPSRPVPRWLALLVALALLPACAARVGPGGEPLTEDDRINRDVLRALADDDDIVLEDLSVETREGVVVISGVQQSLDQVREILRRASRVRGVGEVVNRIRVIGALSRPRA